jgi:heptosyltransferase-1
MERMAPPESVLVLKPSSLGDVIHTLPAVARLKQARPHWRISWLVNPEWAPLLEGNPDIEEIIRFPRREFRGLAGLGRLGKWLRHEMMGRKPHLAIDFQGLLRTALIGRLSGARTLLGAADAREGAAWFYHRTIPSLIGVPHAVERYLALADAALGTADKPPSLSKEPLRFPLPAGQPPEGAEKAPGRFVLLHPFSRGEGKSLTVEQVRAFCARLAPRRVVIAGRTAGEEPSALPDNAIDFLNRTTLPELIWLLRRADFVISVDSGPAHLAAALGRPLVALHTWSDPRRVGPYRPDAWVWKSGVLRRVNEFVDADAGWFTASPSPMSDTDIEAICALAAGYSGFQNP